MAIKHAFVSSKADGADTSLVRPSNWNADHVIDGGIAIDDSFFTTCSLSLTGPGTDQTLCGISSSTYRSAKYQIQITAGTDFHVTEIHVVHDGTDCYMTEYGAVWSNDSLATFNAIIEGGQLKLLATPTSGTKSFRVLTQALKV